MKLKILQQENEDPLVEKSSSLVKWVSFRQVFPRHYIKHETDKETIYGKTYLYIFFKRALLLNRLSQKSKQITLQLAKEKFQEPFWALQSLP